jgi:hypothetical protein
MRASEQATFNRDHHAEPGPSVAVRPEAVGYAVLEQAASYDESLADWRTRMIGRSIGPAAGRAIGGTGWPCPATADRGPRAAYPRCHAGW